MEQLALILAALAIIATFVCTMFSDKLKVIGDQILAKPAQTIIVCWLLVLTLAMIFLLWTFL